MKKELSAVIVLIILFNAILYVLGYHIPRSSFYVSLGLYSLLFVGYITIYKLCDSRWISLKRVLVISVVTRLVLIAATPQLSDDYNRFIWDGHLILNKIDPYQYTPTAVIEILPEDKRPFFNALYEKLNSPEYYSIYPLTNQAVFAFAAFVGQENLLWNILMIRMVLILFEIGTIYCLYLLISLLKIPSKNVLLYALNPLVLIEITGNLHFEGMMLAFLAMALLVLAKKRDRLSGAFFGLSVAVKLTPLLLFPAFINYLKSNRAIRFGCLAIVVVGILFVPILFLGSAGQFFQSIRLYHGIFEFNASVFYVLRFLGVLIFENNPIRIVSPVLSIVTGFIIILHFSKSEGGTIRHVSEGIIFSYLIFYVFNTVVHPWYLITGVGISILTSKRYFLVWSYLIFLSYFTYRTSAYEESTLLLFVQYLGLLAAIVYDYRKRGIFGKMIK